MDNIQPSLREIQLVAHNEKAASRNQEAALYPVGAFRRVDTTAPY